MSVYEMRLFLCIVRRTRMALASGSGRFADLLRGPADVGGLSLRFAVDVHDIIGGSHNYKPLRRACSELMKWQVQYYDAGSKKWYLGTVLEDVVMEEKSGILQFSCPRWLASYICDFSQGGFREYDFERAMSLRNPFAARLYLITCSMSSPLTFGIVRLKQVLGVEGKYCKFSDFERRVLKPAMSELEKEGMNGFSYEVVRKYPSRKSSEAVAVRLSPVRREKRRVESLSEQNERLGQVPPLMTSYLATQLGFTRKELLGNNATLLAFCGLPEWQEKFFGIVERARRKGKNHGYIISAFKKEVSLIK